MVPSPPVLTTKAYVIRTVLRTLDTPTTMMTGTDLKMCVPAAMANTTWVRSPVPADTARGSTASTPITKSIGIEIGLLEFAGRSSNEDGLRHFYNGYESLFFFLSDQHLFITVSLTLIEDSVNWLLGTSLDDLGFSHWGHHTSYFTHSLSSFLYSYRPLPSPSFLCVFAGFKSRPNLIQHSPFSITFRFLLLIILSNLSSICAITLPLFLRDRARFCIEHQNVSHTKILGIMTTYSWVLYH